MKKLKQLIAKRNLLYGEVEELAKLDTTTKEQETRFDEITEEVKLLDDEIILAKKKEEMLKKIALEKATAKTEGDQVQDVIATGIVEDNSPKVKVVADKRELEEARNVHTFKLIQGVMTGNQVVVNEARKNLAEGGHYDNVLKQKDGTISKNFNTLVDTDGAVLVPTSISSHIFTMAQTYGVIPRLSMDFGEIGQNTERFPQVLGIPSFTAVGQGQSITGSGFGLGAIELKANKWANIIPWTNEVADSVATTLMPIIMDGQAQGFAKIQDQAAFLGDGTSTYHGIQGFEGLTGTVNYVRTATAVSGNVSFATLDADDFILPREQVTPGARSGCVYVMHPNMIFTLRKLKDTAGNYIYGAPSSVSPAGTLWGFPIETSEAFPFVDGVTKTVCAFFNPKYIAYGTGKTLSFEELKEGIITDQDGNDINLAKTDQKALRTKGSFDLILSTVTRTTASTAQGAFSVLRTAAS